MNKLFHGALFFLTILAISNAFAEGERVTMFEDKILGIKFEYPDSWNPLTASQEVNYNLIKFSHPAYAKEFPYSLLEQRYTSSQIKIENFFRANVTLDQYLKSAFSKAIFIPNFTIVELNKNATLGGIPAYRLIYNYVAKTYVDDVKVTSFNIFAIKGFTAYIFSINVPTALASQYVPRMQKIVDSFTVS